MVLNNGKPRVIDGVLELRTGDELAVRAFHVGRRDDGIDRYSVGLPSGEPLGIDTMDIAALRLDMIPPQSSIELGLRA
jgi:hypothetical protein